MENIQEIIDYYVNLLIIQYNNKENARGTIDALVSSELANGVVIDIRDGFNIDTASGAQLDILGKYIGIDRFFLGNLYPDNYFGFFDAENPSDLFDNVYGFVDANNPEDGAFLSDDFTDDFTLDYSLSTESFFFLDAEDVVADELRLNDATYRTLLKLKIIQNHSNHSFESISSSIYDFFSDKTIVTDNYNMTMSYLIGDASSNLIIAALQKEVLPRPIGVGMEVLDGNSFFGFADAVRANSTPEYVQGFSDSVIGLSEEGYFLDANRDIITII